MSHLSKHLLVIPALALLITPQVLARAPSTSVPMPIAFVQDPTQRPSAPDTSPFRPLELPAPNLYRTGAGTPGPLYWQQRADYSIRASLDTATHTVRGAEVITYTNNSPDTLRYVWLLLEQNIGAAGNPFAEALNLPGGAFWGRRPEPGVVWGYTIERVGVLRPTGADTPSRSVPLPYRVHWTVMQVTLDEPLPPRGIVQLDLAWSFPLPTFDGKTARRRFPGGWLYQVGLWYPRMAVYDDLRGWNTEQYVGNGEFYLEYGDIDYAITVPAGYTVTGTGTLVNDADMLPAEQRRRLALARRSDTTVHIIAPGEVGSASLLPPGTGRTRTWRFRAEQVRDVAWAAAPIFLWDAAGWNGVLIQALYPPEALPAWSEAVAVGRYLIREYSERLMPYPYPTAIDVAGALRGMEYPMITFNWWRADARGVFNGAMHELGHQWFPMIVGSNERRYGWMDEGIDNFLNLLVWRRRFPDDTTWGGWLSGDGWVDGMRQTGYETPPMVAQDHDPAGGLLAHYIKPAAALHFLRSAVVDSAAFDAALQEYVRRWAFKHPSPADFFRTMNDFLGEDLSWFWRSWFFRTDHLDVALDSVSQRDSADVTISSLHLSRRAEMVAPLELLLVGADSSRYTLRLPAQVWHRGASFAHVIVTPRTARPVRVQLDPRRASPDVDRSNDSWKIYPDRRAP